jgi:hypothetical protein
MKHGRCVRVCIPLTSTIRFTAKATAVVRALREKIGGENPKPPSYGRVMLLLDKGLTHMDYDKGTKYDPNGRRISCHILYSWWMNSIHISFHLQI